MYSLNEIKNKIIYGDNLDEMRKIPDDSVDLIYLDPPFFSGKNYEVIWGDKDEVRSFEDRFKGGIEVYISWMKDRLKEMHRILKSTGSIYLHCDWHASHYLKIEMDKIFGYNNFRNEIVWCYAGGGQSKRDFPKKHDAIFRYSKTNEYTFNADEVRVPYDSDYKGTSFKNAMSRAPGKSYIPNPKGKIVEDWWTNLPRPYGLESLGFPTQKPEALLERVIKASSNINDLVFDPFCGCGTTIAVAKKLKRNFIGIDVSLISCKLISKRINLQESDIIGIPTTEEDILKMKPHEFQQWVCDKMSAKNTNPNGSEAASGADEGRDGIIYFGGKRHSFAANRDIMNKFEGCPLEVKQSKSIGTSVIHKLYSVMMQMDKKYAFIVALSFGKGAYEMVAKLNNSEKANIYLIEFNKLLNLKDGETYMDNFKI